MNWHAITFDEVKDVFQSDFNQGLSSLQVEELQKKYGKNVLPEGLPPSFLKVFISQFKSPLIYLLFLAALAAFVMGEYKDGWVILFVVTLNSIIGSFQEAKAEKSLRDLQKVTTINVRVKRNGSEKTLSARELVPGDVVFFNAGDAIPADIRILEAVALEVSEAVLTGESVPVSKSTDSVDVNAVLGDRRNMLYSGTFITAGRARGIVVAIGSSTEIGKIAELTSNVEEPPTPLSLRVSEFSRYLIFIAIVLFFLIIGIGIYEGISINEIVMISISQVVSMVPEGLPVAMTIAAAIGVRRMADKKTIVRKLSAVETLGSTTVICSDKTGTLTMNKMEVVEVRISPLEIFSWQGSVERDERLSNLFKIAVLCNDAMVMNGKELGDPTETALIRGALKLGLTKDGCEQEFPRTNEIPFDSETKMMATEHRDSKGRYFIAIKGATDNVLELCNLDEISQSAIKKMNEDMASKALRVLAFAIVQEGRLPASFEELKSKAAFLGLMGELDPPREEAKEAIRACREAGIRPVMITGDHKTTGHAIAKMIGLARPGELAIDGKDLNEHMHELDKISVFARVHPSQKLKLVEAFQSSGEVVAMTGDGVNDAPALGKSDVGIAMGITGTEVSKQASKIIITDDNFSTIVTAIAEGRLVYQNIKKIILLLVSTSVAEIGILMLALIFGHAAPFAAVQILWNNLVTEGVITVNLIMDPPEGTEMQRPPISRSEPLINVLMLKRMFFIVPAIVASTFGWYFWRIKSGIEVPLARTEALTVLVICEWFNVLNCRSETRSAFNRSVWLNKWLIGGLVLGIVLHVLVVYWRPLGNYFHTVPVDLNLLPYMLVIGSIVLWVEEIRKLIVRVNRSRLIKT